MIKPALLFIIVVLLSLTAVGQKPIIDTIQNLVNKGSYAELDSFISYCHGFKGTEYACSKTSRTIIDSFDASGFSLESFSRKRMDRSLSIVTIECSGQIAYAELNIVPDDNKPPKQIMKYSNKQLLDALFADYQKTYNTNLNIDTLFNWGMEYGHGCGLAGIELEYAKKLKAILKSNSMAELDIWLRSPILEIQIYALNGFNQLKQKGYALTPDELRLINIIKSKKGTITTCQGCIVSKTNVEDVIKNFKF